MNYPTDLKKMCAKSLLKPEITKVLFGDGVVVATDAYKIIELKVDGTINGLIDPKLLKKGDELNFHDDGTVSVLRDNSVFNIGAPGDADGYPRYKKAMEPHLKAPGNTVRVNRKHLLDLLSVFPDDIIKLRVPSETMRGVIVTGESATGIVMPLTT